jgi:predicted dehydrogenase
MSVKVGVIGGGGMAAYHIEGFKRAGAEVIAIADMNPAVGQEMSEKHGIANIYTDAQEMIDSQTDMDAISIITPNKFHCPLSLAGLKAGKHVFCEKPPALNANEAKEMEQAALDAGKTLMFNFNNRARQESRVLYDYIQAGEMGKINSAQAKWCRRTGIPGFGGWFTNQALSGGGALIDLVHMLDLSMYFMGYPEPKHVMAQTFNDFITDKNFKGPWGIPDRADGVNDVESACHGFISFETGQVVSFQISWAEMVEREEVSAVFQGQAGGGMIRRLFGVDGLDETAVDSCKVYKQEHNTSVNKEVVVLPDESMGRVNSAANFIDAINGKVEPYNTPDQAVKLMRIIDAIYASAKSNSPIQP